VNPPYPPPPPPPIIHHYRLFVQPTNPSDITPSILSLPPTRPHPTQLNVQNNALLFLLHQHQQAKSTTHICNAAIKTTTLTTTDSPPSGG
jgi:hypothetical protein